MSDHPETPVLSRHARQRCAEMGISTKVAKAIHRTRDLTYPGSPTTAEPALVAFSEDHPGYAIVYIPRAASPDVIVTVVFREEGDYIRQGETYELVAAR